MCVCVCVCVWILFSVVINLLDYDILAVLLHLLSD